MADLCTWAGEPTKDLDERQSWIARGAVNKFGNLYTIAYCR